MTLLPDKDLYIFDFDGTLVDTAPDVQVAINLMRRKYNLCDLSLNETKKLIGRGQKYTIDMAIADEDGIDCDEAEKLYKSYYFENMTRHARLYPGIMNILGFLKDNYKDICIVSNKYSYYVERIIESLGCKGFFSFICGPDIIDIKKPEPDMVLYAAQKTGNNIDRTILIGDSEFDVITGKNARITTTFAIHGYGNYDEVVREEPDYLLVGKEDLSFVKYNVNIDYRNY